MMVRLTYLTILSATLMGSSYIPLLPWALLFCYSPLFYSIYESRSFKQILQHSWLHAFLTSVFGFFWIKPAIVEYLSTDGYLVYGYMILFFLFNNIFIVIAASLWWMGRQLSGRIPLIILPLLFFLSETWVPRIFPWNFGYTWFYAELPGHHLAQWVGTSGLSLVTLLFNHFTLLALRQKEFRFKMTIFAGIIFSFILINLFGQNLANNQPLTEEKLNILAIQGNLEQRSDPKFAEQSLKRYMALTAKALQHHREIDLVIWPETAFPSYLDRVLSFNPLAQRLKAFVKTQQVPLITGAHSMDVDSAAIYNAVFLIDKGGSIVDSPYRKRILFPFGEYVPWGKSIWTSGAPARPVEFKTLRFSFQVCYEGLFPNLVAVQSQQGADLIINLANDSKFHSPIQAKHHLYMTLARSVETQLPLIRVTNTGFTGAHSPSEGIHEISFYGKASAIKYQLPIAKTQKPSIFVRFGRHLPLGILVITLLLFFWPFSRSVGRPLLARSTISN